MMIAFRPICHRTEMETANITSGWLITVKIFPEQLVCAT